MKIASISENKNLEKRVAVTPEIAKKYVNTYATHLFFWNIYYCQL